MQERLTRRSALQVGVTTAAAAYPAACGGSSGGAGDNRILFKTWEDHYLPEQLRTKRDYDIAVKVSFIDDNLTNLQQLKHGGRFDVVSADALWVPKLRGRGTDRHAKPGRALHVEEPLPGGPACVVLDRRRAADAGDPHGWSPHLLYYNPDEVGAPPTRGRRCSTRSSAEQELVLPKEPNDILAKAGVLQRALRAST